MSIEKLTNELKCWSTRKILNTCSEEEIQDAREEAFIFLGTSERFIPIRLKQGYGKSVPRKKHLNDE